MRNLKSIVPPLELCKRIPAGEFEDSALVYRFDHQHAGRMFPETNEDERFFYVEEREMVEFAQRNMVNPPPMFPAPTLAEIVKKLPVGNMIFMDSPEVFGAISEAAASNAKVSKENTPEKAALRLWFKINRCF